jgi:cytochrome P450
MRAHGKKLEPDARAVVRHGMQSQPATTLVPTPKPLPPGPSSTIWQMLRYLRDPIEAVLSLGRRYGETFTFPTFDGPIVLTGTPEGIRTIFSADPDTFRPMNVDSMAPILGRGSILLQHGATHRRGRKLMQPPFHGARMRAYGATMREVTLAHLAKTPLGRRFPVEDVFRAISLDVIIRTVFGVDGNERADRAGRDIRDAVASFSPLVAIFGFLRREFGGFGPWARFRRLLAQVHGLLREEIAARRDAGPGEDILSLLVAARDEAGAPMEEQEIVEQLFTMVVAGHETTATALAYAVDELYRVPELLNRLRDELRGIDGAGDPEKLVASPLLDAVCAETLRVHPLIPLVSRKLLRPLEVAGYALPAGVGVGACLLFAHRRGERFPDPETFRPERFLDGKGFSPYEYLPFGGGARRCLGAAFALYEMKIVLGTLLLTADLELVSPRRARTGARAATMGPRGGVPVIRRA